MSVRTFGIRPLTPHLAGTYVAARGLMSEPMAVNVLVRELGALRAETLSLHLFRVSAAVAAEIEDAIEEASQAVFATLDGRGDENAIVGACEAIVLARERIEGCRQSAERSAAIAARSVELRRQAGRLLYESILARSSGKPSEP